MFPPKEEPQPPKAKKWAKTRTWVVRIVWFDGNRRIWQRPVLFPVETVHFHTAAHRALKEYYDDYLSRSDKYRLSSVRITIEKHEKPRDSS